MDMVLDLVLGMVLLGLETLLAGYMVQVTRWSVAMELVVAVERMEDTELGLDPVPAVVVLLAFTVGVFHLRVVAVVVVAKEEVPKMVVAPAPDPEEAWDLAMLVAHGVEAL